MNFIFKFIKQLVNFVILLQHLFCSLASTSFYFKEFDKNFFLTKTKYKKTFESLFFLWKKRHFSGVNNVPYRKKYEIEWLIIYDINNVNIYYDKNVVNMLAIYNSKPFKSYISSFPLFFSSFLKCYQFKTFQKLYFFIFTVFFLFLNAIKLN